MNPRLLDIFEQSTDTHLGQTLIRLSRLAEVVHHYEQAVLSTPDSQITPPTWGDDSNPRPETPEIPSTPDTREVPQLSQHPHTEATR